MSNIRKLDTNLINQIAAGEIIERPSSVIKELMENAIDAGATEIVVEVKDSGKSFIEIIDNGIGMSKEDILLAIQRYATSKLSSNDLTDIHTFGFRGEALPSMTAISRFSIISSKEKNQVWCLEIHGGVITNSCPSNYNQPGTKITVKDLFYATPARLKFLRSNTHELAHCINQFKRLALSAPDIAFRFISESKVRYEFKSQTLKERIFDILGHDFSQNCSEIDLGYDGIKVFGFAGLPTLNRSNTDDQFIFINKRPVRDKYIAQVVKYAYGDCLPKMRYPSLCLYIDIDPREVDVNVHPAKNEVRFRDVGRIKDVLQKAFVKGLAAGRQQTSSHLVRVFENYVKKPNIQTSVSMSQPKLDMSLPAKVVSFSNQQISAALSINNDMVEKDYSVSRFGYPKVQLFKNFIVAQSRDSFFIIDQHAAHERIVYEHYKKDIAMNKKVLQMLAIPEIVDINFEQKQFLEKHQSEIKAIGIEFDFFGKDQIIVRAVPILLKNKDIKIFISDIINDSLSTATDIIDTLLGNMACRASIRSGEVLSEPEMRELLHQMAQTPNIAQCNHGRPTYVELKKTDLERLFERR